MVGEILKLCSFCGSVHNSENFNCPVCMRGPEIIQGFESFSPELAQFNNSFDPALYNILAEVEEKNFWFRSRNELLIWTLGKYFPNTENMLEIGCGTGFVLAGIKKRFPELSLYGSDIYISGLKFAHERIKKAQLFQMDSRRIPFVEEFDIIGAFDVLEHIEEDEVVLSQIHKALKKNGGMILTVPQHPSLWSHTDELACHVCRYDAGDLRKKVLQSGFEILRATSFVSFLLPTAVLSRKIFKKSKSTAENEFNIGNDINYIFQRIMDLERLFIKKGISFHCGLSLLIAARKIG